jgi:hypothetical protein
MPERTEIKRPLAYIYLDREGIESLYAQTVDDARRLIFLAEHSLLRFHDEARIPYFEIVGRRRPGVEKRMNEMGVEGDSVSAYLVDDKLFGPLEDIGVLEKLELVSLEEVYEIFVTYINICVESPGLKEYLKWSRTNPEDDDVYDNLLYLYEKLKKKTPKIRKRKR